MKIADVPCVVTGGASGLGEAAARALVAAGAKVTIFDSNAKLGAQVAENLRCVFFEVDVTIDESVETGFKQSRNAIGQERVLINCAGTSNAVKTASRDKTTGTIKHFPIDAFNKIIQINLVGTFRCVANAAAGMMTLPPLVDGERGVIVTTASAAAEDGQIGQAAYSASKAGIVGMTLPIARDLMNEGIRINSILPGLFNTPLIAAAPEHVRQALAASIPFPKRFGDPSEFASLVLEMCRNSYFNGEDVRLDAAIRMAPR
jgi:NAD(P)-dependent dehydrogenase (short-subunit alcohol dehydrogenase family)